MFFLRINISGGVLSKKGKGKKGQGGKGGGGRFNVNIRGDMTRKTQGGWMGDTILLCT